MKMCWKCDEWEKEAEAPIKREAITKMACPICDREFIGLERTANTIRALGASYFERSRTEHEKSLAAQPNH